MKEESSEHGGGREETKEALDETRDFHGCTVLHGGTTPRYIRTEEFKIHRRVSCAEYAVYHEMSSKMAFMSLRLEKLHTFLEKLYMCFPRSQLP
jgi:hypothetical protein